MQHNTVSPVSLLPRGWAVSTTDDGEALFTFRGSPRAVAEAKARVGSLAGSNVEGIPAEGFAYVIVPEDRRAEALAELREDYAVAEAEKPRKPRNVRPVWVKVSKDDAGNNPAPCSVGKGGTGPASRSGSASVSVKVRDKGEVREALSVDVVGSRDGQRSTLTVWADGVCVYSATFEQ